MPNNRNQGQSPPEEKFGPDPKSTSEQTGGGNGRVMRLFNGGSLVSKPRVYVDNKVTDVAGQAVFYLTDDGLVTGIDRFGAYSQVTARVNSSTNVYIVGWVRVGHTLTVTVNEVTVVAGILTLTAAVGVNVGIDVRGGA